MIIMVFIIAVVVVALLMIGLKLGQWINPKAAPITGSCALEGGELDEDGACAKCEIRDLVDCPENKVQKQKTNN